MKRINGLLAVTAMLFISCVVAVAQDQQCTEDNLNETYTKWYEPYQKRATDPKQAEQAYQIAKEYVNKCPNEFPDNPYAKALKSYVQGYEKVQATGKLATDFEAAVKSNNYAQQVQLGKQITAANPDNPKNTIVYIYMANAGLNDASLSADAVQAAKKAIELIEAGKPFDPAYTTKDQALAAMNYVIAKVTVKTSAADAIPYFIKAAKYDGPLKKDARVYNELAAAYAEQVSKLAKDYQPFVGQTETNESKLILANLNQAIDAQIDALARATALADAANKPALMERLSQVYEDRNKSKTGVNELVAGILAKPLPDPPKPITELPSTTPTPTTTPTPGGTSAMPGGAAPPSSTAAKPSTNTNSTSTGSRSTGTATGSPTGGSAKPAASPTPKPRSRRTNHRG